MAASLLVIVLAVVTGLAVHGRQAERVELDNRSTSQTRAVLLEDAHAVPAEFGRVPEQVRARWTDRDGQHHVGVIPARRSQPAGTEVEVWIGSAGEITSRPTNPANAVFGGIVLAIGVLCAGATLLLATWFAVGGLAWRSNSRRWEREWARVEPQWRRTAR
jgi:hypothetical protein